MIRLATQILLLLGLAGVIAGPGLDAVLRAMQPAESIPPPSIGSEAFSPVSTPPAYTAPKPELFSQTMSRPLFFEGRSFPRPLPAAVAPPPPQPPARPARIEPKLPTGMKLWGIRIDGNARAALVESVPKSGGSWISVGTAIHGWTIERIDSGRVVLRHGSHTATLELYEATPRR